MNRSLGALLLLPTLATATATTKGTTRQQNSYQFQSQQPGGFLRTSQVPNSGKDWISLEKGVEFQSGPDFSNHQAARLLASSSSSNSNSQYTANPFIEGNYKEYDEYAQAWRHLGWFVDCNQQARGAFGYNGDDDGNGSQDYSADGCQRYILWAAYIDLDYQGGGIGEYQFWDRSSKSWDTTPCQYQSNSGSGDGNDNADDSEARCAKMDCHLADTHFSLLGFFKHADYGDWFEQLFKHEGVCVWSDEEYEFMQTARGNWPEGCANTGTYLDADSGLYEQPLYYALKPLSNGGMTIALYTDTKCIEEFTGDEYSIDDILGNIMEQASGSGDNNADDATSDLTLSEAIEKWDYSFDTWKICQPCVAYNLANIANNDYDDGYYDDAYQAGDNFQCDDDAGYTNVNQCMKFMAKTNLLSATFRDISLASQQGTLASIDVSGYESAEISSYYERNAKQTAKLGVGTLFFFCLSLVALAGGAVMYFFMDRDTLRGHSQKIWEMKTPLVFA